MLVTSSVFLRNKSYSDADPAGGYRWSSEARSFFPERSPAYPAYSAALIAAKVAPEEKLAKQPKTIAKQLSATGCYPDADPAGGYRWSSEARSFFPERSPAYPAYSAALIAAKVAPEEKLAKQPKTIAKQLSATGCYPDADPAGGYRWSSEARSFFPEHSPAF